MKRELIEASELLRRQTPEAVERAVDLLQKTVYSFSMKMCAHREDAEDTMQDVLFRSLEHLSKLPDPEALAAWLYTVTKNRCRRMRRPPAHAPAKMLSLDELIPDQFELQALLQKQSDSPEDKVLSAEQHSFLHEAVLQLPSNLRVVLVLHDMEELTTDQVAKILGLRTGTVAVRLHRGRLMLRREMSQVLNRKTPPPAAAAFSNSKSSGRSSRTRRPASCRELFAQLSDYLDGNVIPSRCEEIEAHVNACPNCVAFLNDLKASIDRCSKFDVPCDPAVTSRLRSLFTKEYLRMLGRLPDQSLVVSHSS